MPARKLDSLSFVIPCLDEERCLPEVLKKIGKAKRVLRNWKVEILVCDNGSTDGSAEAARKGGAKVVLCLDKGYGAALTQGILHSRGRVVVMGDADGTYDFQETPRLLDALEKGADLVLGSRLAGPAAKGAMPLLHRYLGTPVLSFLINLIHGRKPAAGITDCNSGFRCFSRASFLKWKLNSAGMEFASEMLVKALAQGDQVTEVPVTFQPADPARKSHLRPFRDGARHLRVILFPRP